MVNKLTKIVGAALASSIIASGAYFSNEENGREVNLSGCNLPIEEIDLSSAKLDLEALIRKADLRFRGYSVKELDKIVSAAYDNSSLPDYIGEEVIREMIYAESRWRPNAVSSVGATGLMQIMPRTWEDIEKEKSFEDYANSPETNLEVGMRYISWMDNYFSLKRPRLWESLEDSDKQKFILAGYNGGPGRLVRNEFNIGKMPLETRNYVEKITSRLNIPETKLAYNKRN